MVQAWWWSSPRAPEGADPVVEQTSPAVDAGAEVVVEAIGRRDLTTSTAGSPSGRLPSKQWRGRTKGLAGVLRDCKPVDADATSVTIGTNGRFHHEQISDPENGG